MRTVKTFVLLPACLLLGGCFTGDLNLFEPEKPQEWTAAQSETLETVNTKALKEWWKTFDDPVLNTIVETALEQSPDRLIAEARVLEARGLRRSAKSSLFPQIGASATAGRQDSGTGDNSVDNFYDAGFDASFELDIFGKNRKNYSASKSQLEAAEAQYHDASLTLIAEVVRSYIDFRAAQNQYRIADKNLRSQEKTLKLVQDLNRLGSAPKLDVERSANLVNTTRASLPEFKRQGINAKLRLSVLTAVLPKELSATLEPDAPIPGANVNPVLMSPADVLRLRPDIRAASENLKASTALSESATAEFFPNVILSGFYGVSDGAFISNATIWDVAIGAAVSLLDFGRIEGQIDAARAREMQAFQTYRRTILSAVAEVETALNDYAHINEQSVALNDAFNNAEESLRLSQVLYKEGEISFLDVLDAQRNANSAESALVTSRAAQAESLTRLFKSLGVY